MRHHKSIKVYTCTNRIYRPKKYFYVSLGSNFLLFFSWRPLSCGGPGQLPSVPSLKSGVAAATGRLALSSDIFCAYGAQQQTRRTPLLRLTDGTD